MIVARATVAAALLALAGCQRPTPGPLVVRLPEGTTAVAPIPAQPGVSQEAVFSLKRLGEVPYDGFSLPLVSPDGSMAAIQSANSAQWPILLGEGAGTPLAKVTIVPLHASGLAPLTEADGASLLLGRSVDAAGFLVEAPQADGSRWIGKVAWTGGAPAWLVRDDFINAHASASSTGLLAWSRRAREGTGFSLAIAPIVEGSCGPVCMVESVRGASWHAPTFSGDGRTLYALRLDDGVLAACAFPVVDGRIETPSATMELSARADARTAYQTLTALRCARTTRGSLALHHPRFARMAIWDADENSVALASPGSVALADLQDGRLLCTSATRLAIEPSPSRSKATEASVALALLDAVWIPVSLAPDGTVLIVHPIAGHLEFAEFRLARSTP